MKTKYISVFLIALIGVCAISCGKDDNKKKKPDPDPETYKATILIKGAPEGSKENVALYMIDDKSVISHMKDVELESVQDGLEAEIELDVEASGAYKFYAATNISSEKIDISTYESFIATIHEEMNYVASTSGNKTPMSAFAEANLDAENEVNMATLSLKRRFAGLELANESTTPIKKVVINNANMKGYLFAQSGSEFVVDGAQNLVVDVTQQTMSPFVYLYPSATTKLQLIVDVNGKDVVVNVPDTTFEANKKYKIALEEGAKITVSIVVVEDWEDETLIGDPDVVSVSVNAPETKGGEFDSELNTLTLPVLEEGLINVSVNTNITGAITVEKTGTGVDAIDFSYEEILTRAAIFIGNLKIETVTSKLDDEIDAKVTMYVNKGSESEEVYEYCIKRADGTDAPSPYGGTRAYEGFISVNKYGQLNLDGDGHLVHFKWGSLVALAVPSSGTMTFPTATLITKKSHDGKWEKVTYENYKSIPYADNVDYAKGLPEINYTKGVGDPCKMFNTETVKYKLPIGNPYNGYIKEDFEATNKTDEHGVNGRLCTKDNIFYPAAGARTTSGGGLQVGNRGYYWGSDYLGDLQAYYLSLESSYMNVKATFSRDYGMTVRCVREN